MKFTITGSLGNIGKPLVKKLIGAGHHVTVITHSTSRVTEIEALGAKAARGDVHDADFLETAFAGAEGIFAMVPPDFETSNLFKDSELAGKAFAEAITKSGVKRVVLLSSIGADLPGGTGPIASLYSVEQELRQLKEAGVTFLRAGYFYTNLYNYIPLIQSMGIMGSNFSVETKLPIVHPEDIAHAAFEELQKSTKEKKVRYIVSDVVTAGQAAKAIGQAIDKPQLSWLEFTNEQTAQGMKQGGMPDHIADLYVEMGTAFRNGSVTKHFFESGAHVKGQIKLKDFAQEFAARFAKLASA